MAISLCSFRGQLALTILVLVVTLLIAGFTNMDLWLEDHFYDSATPDTASEQRWLIPRDNELLELIIHRGMRTAVVIGGVGAAIGLLLSFFILYIKPYRRNLLLMVLGMALVPAVIGIMKEYSGIYCPNQLERYGGNAHHVHLFDFKSEYRHGKCFPAGHASAGFCLMALYFVFRKRSWRISGLVTGLTLGWVMGIYQMLRGSHFLSHTLTTMLMAWLIILILNRVIEVFYPASASLNDETRRSASPGA